VLDPAGQADRVVAVAGLSDQLSPAVIAMAGPVDDLAEHAGQQLAHPDRLAHVDSSPVGGWLAWATMPQPPAQGQPGTSHPVACSRQVSLQ
jgi:hypothetical protein